MTGEPEDGGVFGAIDEGLTTGQPAELEQQLATVAERLRVPLSTP